MYMCYPLGIIMNNLFKSTLSRHLFSTISGFLLQLYMYRGQVIHPILMTVITYIMMKFLPRNF